MQKKTDEFFKKLVKKDYNDELEKVLEKKYFDENTKSILLSILYKIDAAYKDYATVKQNVETKEEFLKNIINSIKNNCDDIKIVKLNSKKSEILKNKTFLVNKKNKTIICYPIERKLLYCISKINKNEKIIKEKYPIIDKTLSDLINVGNNINTVEPMRDFNGYSWTTISREIESIYHNIVYQNIRILVDYELINNWIKNKEFIMDYYEAFQNRLEKQYGEDKREALIEQLENISVLLAIRYNSDLKKEIKEEKEDIEIKLEKMSDNQKFIQDVTKIKKQLTKEIKRIDEILNNKELLQLEYEKRNEHLSLQEKIFSIRILSKIMIEEREEKIKRLEQLNVFLNPQKFVDYKDRLRKKDKYLKLLDVEDIETEIKNVIIELQKIFLSCYKEKIKKVETKQQIINLIYQFRYYNLIPISEKQALSQIKEIRKKIKEVEMLLIEKAHELKVIDVFSEEKGIDYTILKNIFYVRVIKLEDLYLKINKEKDKYYVQLFDENVFEEKIEINLENLNKKELTIKLNKKVQIFN